MTQVNFVVDCSGSMGATAATWKGYKFARFEVMRTVIATALNSMKGGDKVCIVEFESNASTLVPPTKYLADVQMLLTSYGSGSEMALYPRGGTNIPAGMKEAFKNADKKDKNITFVITDMWDPNGDYISHALNADCGNGDSCFKALADLGPVHVIVIGDRNSKIQMEKGCKGLNKLVSQDYGINWDGCFSVPLGDLGSLGYFNKLIYEFTDHYGTLSLGPERQHTRQPY